ncbi:MAG: hypothetical protein KJ573_07745 [Proteobacteria bacterium]|nr:hypothetical protein [Desulfobacterales bacterium]MBL7101981.1 hypothetical protein [Desulfobacteraceae bacterium]MBU0735247.1 hypothetical protein [Pseudomonadota bacterium]MBL7173678.1 hypothetical protein [Desulfobacteraceae bacterium]MBU0988784.1 hypothetical protein [Pseudomonadota bacterium]
MSKSIRDTFSILGFKDAVVAMAVAMGLGLALSGCAALQNQKAIETERLLAASGFQMRSADTPQKLDHLKSMTQRKLVLHQHEGKIYYVYADATSCQCLYVGNEKAYGRYQEYALQKNIADEQRRAAEMNENASMNWGLWGPWGPWGPAGPWE